MEQVIFKWGICFLDIVDLSGCLEDSSPVSTEPIKEWTALFERIKTLLPIVQTNWEYPFPEGSEEQKMSAWTMADVTNYGPVNDLLPDLIQRAICGEKHQPYRYFLRMRLIAAHHFIYQLICWKGGLPAGTIFPFPDKSQDDILRWLLTDWWQGSGSAVTVNDLVGNHGAKFRPSKS